MVSLAEPTTQEPVVPLTPEERIRLGQLERIVEKNITGFILAGKALLEIRESKLWRGKSESFGAYAKERFGLHRSTADQLCRSTMVYQNLALTTGAANSATPVPENIPEIVLRPLSTLPDKNLQAQTWRLAAKVSPEGKPTRSIASRVVRLVKDAISPAPKAERKSDAEPMFIQSVQRLAKIDSFRPDLAVSHVTDAEQAMRISEAGAIVASRCYEIRAQLANRFPELASRA
jgi:hypothetical protein